MLKNLMNTSSVKYELFGSLKLLNNEVQIQILSFVVVGKASEELDVDTMHDCHD